MVPPIDPAWNSTSSTQPQLPLWMPRPRAPEGEICSWRSGDSSRGRGLYEQTGCNWIVGFIWQYVYSIMQLCTGRGLQDQFHVPFLNISSLLGESMANKRCSSKIIQAKNIGTILLYIYIYCVSFAQYHIAFSVRFYTYHQLQHPSPLTKLSPWGSRLETAPAKLCGLVNQERQHQCSMSILQQQKISTNLLIIYIILHHTYVYIYM